MRVEDLLLQVRPRRGYESLDLGFVLARKWYLPLFLSWMLVQFPFLILALWIGWDEPWIAGLLIWWLKPLGEIGQLEILSRSIFGAQPTTRQIIADLPGLLKKHALPSLITRRLSFRRSFFAPVYQLELQKGANARKRKQLLASGKDLPSGWLTVVFLHLEAILAFAVTLQVMSLIPGYQLMQFLDDFAAVIEQSWLISQIGNGIWWLIIGLLSPFYTAAGFSLYLNRRTNLEAWDIELSFRKLQQRVGNVLAGLLIAFVVAAGSVVMPQPAMAEQSESQSSLDLYENAQTEFPQDATEAEIIAYELSQIKKQPPFVNVETVTSWQLKDAKNDPDGSFWDKLLDSLIEKLQNQQQEQQSAESFPDWIAQMSSFARVVLWICVAVVLGWLLYRVLKLSQYFQPAAKAQVDVPEASSGYSEHLDKSRLPDNVPQAVIQLWDSGQKREAMSLLYRGALFRVQQLGAPLSPSMTEMECLAHAQKTCSTQQRALLVEITDLWMALAYAHLLPDDQQLRSLCQRWQADFSGAAVIENSHSYQGERNE